jgi:hypothetical protein
MSSVTHHNALKPLGESILHTVLYYDIFSYPLTSEEVYRFLPTNHVTEKDVLTELQNLTEQKYLFQFDEFFTAQNKPEWIPRRVQGNCKAEEMMRLAEQQAKFISRFPFVRAVMGSGSLSKGYMDERSDLDFFIVTQPGRLWIARMILVMYKRVFLSNSHKHFCVNYFVDSDHLEIEEKNIFTATELATVIPFQNGLLYQQLLEKNSWLHAFFPNFKQRRSTHLPVPKKRIAQSLLECAINLLGGNFWERHFMKMTQKRWDTLYQKSLSSPDFKVAFKTKTYASKNHPKHFQRRVIEQHQQRLGAFCKQFNIAWMDYAQRDGK